MMQMINDLCAMLGMDPEEFLDKAAGGRLPFGGRAGRGKRRPRRSR
jgi:hypothetical protein